MSQSPKKEAVTASSYQTSEELFQTLFEQAADGIFITDEYGRFVEVNRRGCEMLGFTREEILNLSLQDLIPAEDLARDPLQLDALRAGKTLLKERYLCCKDGDLLPVEINARMLSDGNFLGMVRDITERKQVEQELQRSNDLLRAIIEAAPTAIIGLDLDGNVQMVWNPAAEKMLGWSAEEAIGRPLPSVPVENQEEFRRFREWIRSGKTMDGVEVRRQRRDGSPIDYSIYASALHDAEGRITGNVAVLVDITERKQAEEALRQAHQDYATLINSVDGIVWEADARTFHFSFVSQQAERLLGYPLERWLTEPTFWKDHIHPDDRDWAVNFCAQSTREKRPHKFEYRMVAADGRVAWLHDIVTVKVESDQPVRLQGIMVDITERKQADEALHASEARFRTFVDHAADAFFLLDDQATIRNVNRQACESLGYNRQELVGMSPFDFDVDADRSFVEQIRSRLAAEEMVAFDTRYRRKDGSVFPVEVRARPFWQGERRFSVAMVHDISERKQAQQALTLFRSLIDHTNDAIEVIDPKTGRFLDANEQAYHTLGYTREEFLTLTVPEINPVVAARTWKETVEELQRSGSIIRESQHRRKDGSVFPVEININYIRLDRAYVLAVVRDITERKQLEAENEQLAAQFYQAQKIESIGRLAGGIAHDFNNLLVPIIGYIDLNLMDLAPDSKLFADLTQVRKAADRAADLTRQILAFSRQQVLELSLLDLNLIIDEFKKMLQRLIGEDVELHTFLSPTLDLIKADKGQIEQVLMNLVINSRDAMPTGGKLTIETTNVFLDEVYLEKYASDMSPGHYVMLAVSDTGQGMDADTRQRIFDPFFTTKESGKGTGLGLATVFGIIKQHQGHIWVYSEPGQGTTFKLYLPQAQATLPTTPPIAKESRSIYGSETVLVVEDEDMVRKFVCETLEAHGYDVVEAHSPSAGLELAAGQATIHLVLTDVIMPEMNGKELYQQIAAIHPNSRVLYMSGYTHNVVVHHSILEENIHFLQKPFTVCDLTQKVRAVLD